MPDPITTAAGAAATAGASVATGKLFNVGTAFLGYLVAIGNTEEKFKAARLAALALFSCLAGYHVPPSAVAYMQQEHVAPWLQSEGLIAMLIGWGCIFINRGFNSLGRRFSKDPVGVATRRGQDSAEGDGDDKSH